MSNLEDLEPVEVVIERYQVPLDDGFVLVVERPVKRPVLPGSAYMRGGGPAMIVNSPIRDAL